MGFKNFGVYSQIHKGQTTSNNPLQTELITQMMSNMNPNFNFNQNNTSQTDTNEESETKATTPQQNIEPFVQMEENNLTNTTIPLFPQLK